jgi:recombinational DNA repair protein (RecF pathway)
MSYTIYTTPAYILEKYETGEHDITLLLMTRDHGLLYVRATGMRKGTSKMRMHLHL